MKTINLIVLLFVLSVSAFDLMAQEKQDSELFKTIKAKDDLLFNVGFNKCDISQFERLVSDNFEFYHDKSGATVSKAAFIKTLKEGLCKSPDSYQSRRELIEGSMEIYPLKDNGVLYGAMQIGKHRFYETQKGKPEREASTAQFTQFWKLENGEWKLSRIFSYDHQPFNQKE
jgi:hypothetical protein